MCCSRDFRRENEAGSESCRSEMKSREMLLSTLRTTERGSGTATPRKGPDLPTGLFERQGPGKGRMRRKMPDLLLSGSRSTRRRVQPLHPSPQIFVVVRRSDLSARMEQIRPCPVHPGKSAFLPVKSAECRSLDSLRSLGMTRSLRSPGMAGPRPPRSGAALTRDDMIRSRRGAGRRANAWWCRDRRGRARARRCRCGRG